MHLDEEQVQRILHGELSHQAETRAREHVAACIACRERVAEAEREENELNALLTDLDHAPPRIDVADVIAAAATAGAHRTAKTQRPDFARGRRIGFMGGWLHFASARWAAGLVVALGIAGAAYAVPGSPLPALVQAVAHWIASLPQRSPSTSAPEKASEDASSAPAPRVDLGGGIAVDPGRTLLIVFSSPQAQGNVRVSLTDGPQAVVRAPIGSARFTSDVNRLLIDNQGSRATFEIQIPRAAPRVEIRVGGNRIFLKEGPGVNMERHSSDGTYVLPLTPSGS